MSSPKQKGDQILMQRKRTILMYGRTRAGKSTQIGELAEHIFKTEGKTTRLYTVDRGGADPVRPYVDLGIIEVIEQLDSDPWIFLNKATRGMVRDKTTGKWVNGENTNIGMFAFESMTSFADALMASLAEKSAEGINIAGQANVSFTMTGDGETLKVGGSNMGHYNVVQTRITNEVWNSQKLNAPYILWTASVSKDDDQVSVGKVLGPAVVGKALTAEVPRWFNLTFRIDAIAAQAGKPERHVLYLGNSVDQTAGNATSLGNTRTPKDAPELPSMLEPASLVKALELIDGGYGKALEAIKARLASSNISFNN